MKVRKKLIPALILWLVLFVAVACYWIFGQTTFDQAFQGYAAEAPAGAAHSLGVSPPGSYPGLSSSPVSPEEAQSYQALLGALRSQKYLPLPALLDPPSGGISLSIVTGCSPSYIAYWDGTLLWIPTENSDSWRPYVPLSPAALDQSIRALL